MTINGHTYKLFKNIFWDVQTEEKGEINTAYITTAKIVFLILYQFEGLKKQLCITIKGCKINLSNNIWFDMFNQ